MEIELKRDNVIVVLIVLAVFALIGLGALGAYVTPLSETGGARLLGWQDWRVLRTAHEREAKARLLLDDLAAMFDLLNAPPDPVAAQMLLERTTRHAQARDETLVAAQEAVLQAAVSVRDWAVGTAERDAALDDVEAAFARLQPNR